MLTLSPSRLRLLALALITLFTSVLVADAQAGRYTVAKPGKTPPQVVAIVSDAVDAYGLGRDAPGVLLAQLEIESAWGTSKAAGVQSGTNAYGCCAGPAMFCVIEGCVASGPDPNFRLEDIDPNSAWGYWGVDANGDGVANPWDLRDAIYTQTRYMAAALEEYDRRWIPALMAYNPSREYAKWVLKRAKRYGKKTNPAS